MADPTIREKLNDTINRIGITSCREDADCEAKVRAPIEAEVAGMTDAELTLFEESVFFAFNALYSQCLSNYSSDAVYVTNPESKPEDQVTATVKWPKGETVGERFVDCYRTAITGNAPFTKALKGEVNGVEGGRESIATSLGNMFYPDFIKYIAERARKGEKVVTVEKVVTQTVGGGGSIEEQIGGEPTGFPKSIAELETKYPNSPEHVDEVIRLFLEASEMAPSSKRGEIADSIVKAVEPYLKGTDDRAKASGLAELQKRYADHVNPDTGEVKIGRVPSALFTDEDPARFEHLRKLYRQALAKVRENPESVKLLSTNPEAVVNPLAEQVKAAAKPFKTLRGIDVKSVDIAAGVPTNVTLTGVDDEGKVLGDDKLKEMEKAGSLKDIDAFLATELGFDPKSDSVRLAAAKRLFAQAVKKNAKVLDEEPRKKAVADIRDAVKKATPPKNAYLLMVTGAADNGALTFKTLPPEMLEGESLSAVIASVNGGIDAMMDKVVRLYNEAVAEAGEANAGKVAADLAATMNKIFSRPKDEAVEAAQEFLSLNYKGKVGDKYKFVPGTGKASKDAGSKGNLKITYRNNGDSYAVGLDGKARIVFSSHGAHSWGMNIGASGGQNVGKYSGVNPVQRKILAGSTSSGDKDITGIGEATADYLYSTGETENGLASVKVEAGMKGEDLLGMQLGGAWGEVTYMFAKGLSAVAGLGAAKLFTIGWNPIKDEDVADDLGWAATAKVGGTYEWGDEDAGNNGSLEATINAVGAYGAAEAASLGITLSQSFGLFGMILTAAAEFNASVVVPDKGEDVYGHSGSASIKIPLPFFDKLFTISGYGKYAAETSAQTSYGVGGGIDINFYKDMFVSLGIGKSWLAEGEATEQSAGGVNFGSGDVASGVLNRMSDKVMQAFERSGLMAFISLTIKW